MSLTFAISVNTTSTAVVRLGHCMLFFYCQLSMEILVSGRDGYRGRCLAKLSKKKIGYGAVTGKQDQPRHIWKASDSGKDTEAPRSILSMFHVCHTTGQLHQISKY